MLSPSKTKLLFAPIFQILLFFGSIAFFLIYWRTMPISETLEIVNIHEHVESIEAAGVYQRAAASQGIQHTVILGSPEAAFHAGHSGFHKADANNELMLKLARDQPARYTMFVTVDPEDPHKLEKLRKYVRQGAKGLKLYSGHTQYRRLPLLEESMKPVFDYCEKKGLPVMFHVNPALYQNEFESVLNRYPRLKVICPHFCLSTIRSDRFESLMNRYPNLYTDLSFGFIEFFKEALIRFSDRPDYFRQLLIRYQDRVFFGLDLVVTIEDYKNSAWYEAMMRAYRDLLEKDQFLFSEMPGVVLRGFYLEPSVLRKIYSHNFRRLMRGRAGEPF